MIPARKPGHVADVADGGGGDDRADLEQPGQAGPGRPDRCGEFLPGLADRRVDAAEVLGELCGELAAGRRSWTRTCRYFTGCASPYCPRNRIEAMWITSTRMPAAHRRGPWPG